MVNIMIVYDDMVKNNLFSEYSQVTSSTILPSPFFSLSASIFIYSLTL